ncbi:MAG TPA: MFS transporter [Bryobacteraceae bacterium]|nr:MFS transporter [Bryobacteraceae bacterium]
MIRNLRWWIGGLLFASTIINYIDRQTLSVLAPYLKNEYHWTNTDFAMILIAFRVAYALMQGLGGRFLDWMGTRRGLTITVTFYSAVAMTTAFARGMLSFSVFRFLLGAGEGPNWPGATKAVSEWFPDRERAWAVALFDSGSSIGGAIAPFLVVWLYQTFGTWRPAFLFTGCLGFIWLIFWRRFYRIPEKHPRLSPEELAYIRQGKRQESSEANLVGWRKLLRYKQTWGIIIGRSLIDPYWYLIAEWFAIYLVSKGFKMEDSVLGFWVPFLAADLGNFFGGGLSSYWVRRGWPVGKSRRAVLLIFGPSMLLLIPAAFSSNYYLLISLVAYATFAYAACSTIFLALPADVFHSRAVASVSGMSGAGASLVTLFTTYLIGRVTDRFSFQPVLIAASLIPCMATFILVGLVRASKKPDPDGILMDF